MKIKFWQGLNYHPFFK